MNQEDFIDPTEYVLDWFYGLPPGHREQLARTYWTIAGNDVNNVFLSGDEVVEKFEAVILQPDFPIRRIARLVQLRAMIDFIFEYFHNLELFSLSQAFSFVSLEQEGDTNVGVVSFGDKQWERDIRNWQSLWVNELSNDALDAWLHNMNVNEGL